jgi:hypothetical protein
MYPPEATQQMFQGRTSDEPVKSGWREGDVATYLE